MRKGPLVLLVAFLTVVGAPAVAAGDENAGPVPAPRALDRASLTAEIVATWRAEASALGLDLAAWEADMRGALQGKNEGQLVAIKSAKSLADVRRLLGASPNPLEPNALGDDWTDLVYFNLLPCRILDTRIGTGLFAGPLPAARITYVNHNQNLSAQGGNAAGCGVPFDPAAIAATVTVAAPAGPGDLRVYPFGATEPNASVINYSNVPGLNLANTTIIPTSQLSGSDFVVLVDVSATHVIIDVVGYYWKPAFGSKPGFIWAAAHVTGSTPTVDRYFNNIPGGSAVTVSSISTGTWNVNFGADVSTRFYSISIGNAVNGTPTDGFCEATPGSGIGNVFVSCEDFAGNRISNNFFLSVY